MGGGLVGWSSAGVPALPASHNSRPLAWRQRWFRAFSVHRSSLRGYTHLPAHTHPFSILPPAPSGARWTATSCVLTPVHIILPCSYSPCLLHPPTSPFRRALDDDELGGYKVPKGSDIFISTWNLHR